MNDSLKMIAKMYAMYIIITKVYQMFKYLYILRNEHILVVSTVLLSANMWNSFKYH